MELTSLRKGIGLSPAKLSHKSALREYFAQRMDMDSRSLTGSQVHNALLVEISKLPETASLIALQFAFSIVDQTRGSMSLLARRRLAAQKLGKHPDTIIRYEGRALQDLVAHLEGSSDNAEVYSVSGDALLTQKLNAQLEVTRNTAILSLTGLLPVGDKAAKLVGYLERSQRPYLNVEAEVKFLPSARGPKWYRVQVRYSFAGRRSTFRLAVVTNSEDGEQLIARGLVDEFHKLNDQIDSRLEVRAIINGSRFMAYDPAANSQKLFRFHEIDKSEASRLLQSVGEPIRSQCRFLEIKIPTRWQVEGITYEYQSALNLRDDIHYAYWYAPSMMYVKRLIFDYSQFPGRDSWNFIVMPFLGNVTGESIRGAHSFIVRPDNWLMPGHGIALMWEPSNQLV